MPWDSVLFRLDQGQCSRTQLQMVSFILKTVVLCFLQLLKIPWPIRFKGMRRKGPKRKERNRDHETRVNPRTSCQHSPLALRPKGSWPHNLNYPKAAAALLLKSKHAPIITATMMVCFPSEKDVTISSITKKTKTCWQSSGSTTKPMLLRLESLHIHRLFSQSQRMLML